MEDWKDPQTRAEEEGRERSYQVTFVGKIADGGFLFEDGQDTGEKPAEEEDGRRGYDALAVDGSADNRESSGKAVHVDGVQAFPPKALEHMADSREKLEADVVRRFPVLYEVVMPFLDRQAAITEREHPGLTISDDESLINWRGENYLLQSRVLNAERERDEFSLKLEHEMELNRDNRNALDLERIAELQATVDKLEAELSETKENAERQRLLISELEMLHVGMKAQRDALQQKVDELELRERCAQDYDYRQAAEMWEQAFEDKCAELILLQEKVDELTAQRDEAVRAYDAHIEAHDLWHEPEDITYTRNRFSVLEQAKNERIEKLTAERDEWKTKCETREFAYKQADAERKRYSEQIDELFAERDELKAELRECDEQRLEYRDQRDHLQANVDELSGRLEDHIANGDRLFNALIDTTAERDRLLEQLNRVWLKDADGNPLHIGESRYGEDGTGWRVTGFRWGSSHPVQGVDKDGRRRDLKPEWLRSERPDSLGSLLEDVRRGALAYPRDRITGYLEDNHSIGEAVLLDVRDRIEKLVGGSE